MGRRARGVSVLQARVARTWQRGRARSSCGSAGPLRPAERQGKEARRGDNCPHLAGFADPEGQESGVGERERERIVGGKRGKGPKFAITTGVYADDSEVKKLREKYGALSVPELKENKEFIADVLESDLCMTVRLQIVYGKLSIRSVRSAFEKSVRSRLEKFGRSDNKELLKSFVSLFSDEYKLPKGSVIELSREEGYVLQTRIDGKEVGRIQSKLLCRSILDLYLGEDPFDKKAKDVIQLNLAIVSLPVMFLGLFTSGIQALIFATLAAAYIGESMEGHH
uniref:Chalcone--flavanone isomerase n=1 Tax=Ananas comosus var. bracteatus TaxID=296719 RepID=A0A6V7QB84_ANACO|nr:unnamed protein product [Ananas comosus var. bracteatus]